MKNRTTRRVIDFAIWACELAGVQARRYGIILFGGFVICLGVVTIADASVPELGNTGPADPGIAQNTGSANFRIDIEVPPGPGGLTPNLALNYSSRRGDGPYGVGWGLELGEIRCSTRFGIPDYAYADCERFELDGQLLTQEETTDSYHSFVETFQQIEYLSGSQSWQVINPNGTILRYGVDSDARVFSGGNIARWLLSEIQDPFGNSVFITYDDTTDPGTRYPLQVTYGAGATKGYGKRQIGFIFGNRPDSIHDYAGGIDREITKRLTDIKVSSYGALVRRYVFGYDGYDENGVLIDYTTGRSRLSWVQQFGSDCTGSISDCTGLPRQEYEYTDPNDEGTMAQYSKFEKDGNYLVPMAGGWWAGVPPVRIADVNGDGLPDLIKGGRYFGYDATNTNDATRVEINTGSGFVVDSDWTNALLALEVERPRADFTQIKTTSTGQDVLHTGDSPGIFSATYTTVTRTVGETPPSSMARPDARYSMNAISSFWSGAPLPGWIEGLGRLYFTDVDADGLADIIVSVRLSGVDQVVDSNGNPILPAQVQRVSGKVVRKVYRNTGDPIVGWAEDDELAKGLPPFGIVQFESGYGAESRIPFGLDTGPNGAFQEILAQGRQGPCSVRGLNGWWLFPTKQDMVPFTPDVCINQVNLDPRFQDFNGDGVVDLMVLELDDPEALHQGFPYHRGTQAPPLPNNHGRSRVWIQDPDASDAGTDRWVRAPEYDLPDVVFGTAETGGFKTPPLVVPFPFAHSQPQLSSGLDPYLGCPGAYDGFVPEWEYCAPLSENINFGLSLVDLNRDGLTDVIWSQYSSLEKQYGDSDQYPLIAQGVLLNTGTGWCSSIPEMSTYVESVCAHAAIYYPPANSYPDPSKEPSGFAFENSGSVLRVGQSTGYLADLNADGWLDYIQAHTTKGYPGNKAWLFNPAGASGSTSDMWVRDPRYDLDIDYPLMFATWGNGAAFSVLDINGDGVADIVGDDLLAPDGVTQIPQAFISNSKHSDLLRLARNGRGGQVAISYESAILQRDPEGTGLELEAADHASAVGETLGTPGVDDVIRWTSAPVVSEIRIAGPNREPDPNSPIPGFGPPTTYKYAHPRFCVESQSDLGFRVVERTRPGGEVVTRSFYQVHGRAGKTSRVIVADGGEDRHLYEEYWETGEFSAQLPDQPGRSSIPTGLPGSYNDPGGQIHVGRLARMRYFNLYDAGSATGARTSRTFYYDDSYGYNFAEKIVESRPTGTRVELRVPASDAANGIFGLVVEEKIFDYDPIGIGSTDFLSHATVGYQLGRPSSVVEMVKPRDGVGAGTAEARSMTYDPFGNLSSQTVEASAGDRVTSFCYDGDSDLGGMPGQCPNVGQDSRSVRVGVMDAKGGIVSFIPDPGTGAIVETHSTYADEPSASLNLDVFGRPTDSFVHDGTNWLRTSRTLYDDLFMPPVVMRYDYPDAGSQDTDAIWSSVISDGFGGVWKEIGETSTGFVGTFTYHDPALRMVRATLPIACSDGLCGGMSGKTEDFAMLTEVDAIGRPIRNDTPDGFSFFEYFSLTKTAGPGTIGVSFDGVLEKNGKGDLIQRAMDGGRVGWVDECGNTVAPGAVDSGTGGCTGSTQTHYSYEATGEIGTIYDARAGSSSFSDPNHYLRYHYDTLGRVLQIDDPALTGSGSTLTSYDDYGNIKTVTNARLQTRTHSYDELNRLTGITTPAGETDYSVSYRANEKQSSGDSSDDNDYARTLTYDDLGRVQQEQMAVRNGFGVLQNFYTDYRYDLIGRVTEVVHPAQHYEAGNWVNTVIRYEYDRGFLTQICDLGGAANCDSATTNYVSSATFDPLGRPKSFAFPGGTRTFAYNANTQRLSQDEFVSAGYQYTRNYTGYDGVGNVVSITGSESASPALDMNETYAYDQRNRISQWTKESVTYDYGYDDLGNLILHGGETQVYDDLERPHAIKQRALTSPINYTYDADGNVESILGGPSPQYFQFDSANQIICLSASNTSCDTRVVYDVGGKRVAEYPSGGGAFKAYIGEAFLWEQVQTSVKANVEIMLDGKRIALKRFDPQLRAASAGLLDFPIPPWPWMAGGMGGLGLLLLGWGMRNGTFVLVELRPLRAAAALGAAASLFLPSVTMAGGGGGGASAPAYYWEISDPLGTGMVMLDVNGDRVRHQVFTPFGRIHAEEGASLRTFYAGHRRDDDSGMFYMQARWYDPGAGRFLSVDPLIRTTLIPQSANPYSYTENNPVNGVDPTGTIMDWAGPSGRPFIFNMNGLGWVDTTTTTTTTTNTDTGEVTTTTTVANEGSVAGGSAGLSQAGVDAIGNGGASRNRGTGSTPFDAPGVETFQPVIGEGPASHTPSQLNSLFSGVGEFPVVTPNSFATFMNGLMNGGLAMSASPASLPVRPSPTRATENAALARRNVAFLATFPGPSSPTFLGIMGVSTILWGASLEIGALAILAGLAVPVVGVSLAGIAILGAGLVVIGGSYVYLSRRMSLSQ